jgi:hypothetical protein
MAEGAPQFEGTVSMKTPKKEVPKPVSMEAEDDLFEGSNVSEIETSQPLAEKEAAMPERPAEPSAEKPRELSPEKAARLTKIQEVDSLLKEAIYGETADMDGTSREYIGSSEERVGAILAAYDMAAETLNDVLGEGQPDRKDLGNLEGMLFKATRMLEIAKPLGWNVTPEQQAKISEVQKEYPHLKDAIVKAEQKPAKREQKETSLQDANRDFVALEQQAKNLENPNVAYSTADRLKRLGEVRFRLQNLENQLGDKLATDANNESLKDLVAKVFQRIAATDQSIEAWRKPEAEQPLPELAEKDVIELPPMQEPVGSAAGRRMFPKEEMDEKEVAINANVAPAGEGTKIIESPYVGEQTKAQARGPRESVDETVARLRAEPDRTQDVFGSTKGERSAEAAEFPESVEAVMRAEDAAEGKPNASPEAVAGPLPSAEETTRITPRAETPPAQEATKVMTPPKKAV